MPSIFYQEKFDQPLLITGLFLERLGVKVEEAGGMTEENAEEILSQCLVDCQIVQKSPTEEQLAYVLSRLQEKGDKDKSTAPESSGKGKHFAGFFTSWANSMDFATLCLYIADYNHSKARELYENLDQRSVVALAHERLRFDFEKARVSFEACLFGFGGGYGKTPNEGDIDIDLTTGGERANKAFEELTKGFF